MKVQLQVWIAAFSTISNGLLAYGFAEGVAIRFWYIAQCGTTVRISSSTPRLPIFSFFRGSSLLPVDFNVNSGLIRLFPPRLKLQTLYDGYESSRVMSALANLRPKRLSLIAIGMQHPSSVLWTMPPGSSICRSWPLCYVDSPLAASPSRCFGVFDEGNMDSRKRMPHSIAVVAG
jgi:hypothetical protein